MSIRTIGEIIKELREEKNISQDVLCKGLCSPSTLAKIENGERMPEILLVDSLLTRLGKSPERLEVITSYYNYCKMELSDDIIDDLRRSDYDKAVSKLAKYKKEYGDNGMDGMFIQRMKAILSYQKQEYKEAEEQLIKVIYLTLPDFDIDHIKPYTMATYEVENLLMYCDILIQTGRVQEAAHWLEKIVQYIEECITDADERSKVFPKALCLWAVIALKEEKYEKAIELSERAVQNLIEQFSACFVTPNLRVMLKAAEKLKDEERINYCNLHIKNFTETYALMGQKEESIDAIYYSPSLQQIFLDNEIIKGERLKNQLSQTEFVNGIYNDESTLSRLENGKTRITNQKLVQILEKLGVNKGRYNCYLSTTDYEALEKLKQFQHITKRRDYKAAEKILNELEAKLDLGDELNFYQIEIQRLSIAIDRKEVEYEEAFQKYMVMLKKMDIYRNNEFSRKPFPTELAVITQLGSLYNRMNQKEKAAELLRRVLETYRTSRIKERYVFRSVSSIRANLCKYCEELDNLEESIAAGESIIQLGLQLGRARGVSRNLVHLAAAMEKRGTDPLDYYVKSYYLCSFYNLQWEKNIIHKYLMDEYGIVL